MEARRDVFQAIADPTRRDIIGLISKQSLSMNAIAESFDMTRQAISLHVKILAECGLVVISQQGRERYCEARLEKLDEVQSWIEQYREFWSKKMTGLKTFLEKEKKKQNIKNTKRNKPINKRK